MRSCSVISFLLLSAPFVTRERQIDENLQNRNKKKDRNLMKFLNGVGMSLRLSGKKFYQFKKCYVANDNFPISNRTEM